MATSVEERGERETGDRVEVHSSYRIMYKIVVEIRIG